MKAFLTEVSKKLVQNFSRSRVHAVIGNESCDLDSAVSATCYAFYLNKTSKQADTVFVPVLNIPRQQFRLRTESVHFFNKFGIGADNLVFKDQIDLNTLHKEGRLVLTLVDHNALTGSDVILEDCVTSVFDHHVRQRPESEKVKVRLEMVGSCATLITEQLLNDPDFTVNQTLAELLYGTILVDTINKSPHAKKTTPLDVQMLDKLSPLVPHTRGDDLFKELEDAKFNVSELTNSEILARDTKVVSDNSMTVAVSSVTMQMEEFLKRADIKQDLSSFTKDKNADVLVLMTISHDSDHVPVREIAVYTGNKPFREKISTCLENSTVVDLQLTKLESPFEDIVVYHQGYVPASRKQILPIIQTCVGGN